MLNISIVLLGSGLDMQTIFGTGMHSVPTIFTGAFSSFLIANLLGKSLKKNSNLRNLIGAGTGICGGSAIAALSSVIDIDERDISYSLSTIFLFNIVGVFLFPAIGHWLHMTQKSLGMSAGSAINDTSSAIASGYIYGNDSGEYATTVKLARSLMTILVVFVFLWVMSYRNRKDDKPVVKTSFPWSVIGFIAASIFNSLFCYLNSTSNH